MEGEKEERRENLEGGNGKEMNNLKSIVFKVGEKFQRNEMIKKCLKCFISLILRDNRVAISPYSSKGVTSFLF